MEAWRVDTVGDKIGAEATASLRLRGVGGGPLRRDAPLPAESAVPDENTTAAGQRYLDALAGEAPVEPIIRALLDRSVRRLHHLCTALLHQVGVEGLEPPTSWV